MSNHSETITAKASFAARVEAGAENSAAVRRMLLWAPVMLVLVGQVAAQEIPGCGTLANGYGPYDYSNIEHRQKYLPVVERVHLTPEVLALKERSGTGDVALDIDYTLRAFPNHPAALDAMARLQISQPRSPTARYFPIECYFKRAELFAPTDPAVKLVQAIYLRRIGKPEQALENLVEAVTLAPESPEVHYNLGLLYFDLGDHEKALEHGKRAYELGYPLPGLRRKLERAGKWPEVRE